MNRRKLVDRFSGEKTKRGRPRIARYLEVWGRAENYRLSLSQAWPQLSDPLLKSERVEDVIKAFENHAQPHAQDFVPRVASDIFTLIKEAKFPKRAKAQINYIAKSVAGRPTVSLRTSRDICGKKRHEEVPKSPHKIVRNSILCASVGIKDRQSMMPVESVEHRFLIRRRYCGVPSPCSLSTNTCEDAMMEGLHSKRLERMI